MSDITDTIVSDVCQPQSQDMPSRRVLIIVVVPARAILHWVETWYFNDGVRDLIEPIDADDAGGTA